MTALNYLLTENCVIISMDTLTSRDYKTPLKYSSKIYPLPHLNSVLCGTGSHSLIINWFSHIQGRILAKDIHGINEIAESELPILNGEDKFDSDIYHFGYDIVTKKFVGYVFRESNKFKVEKLPYTMGIRPSKKEIVQNIAENKYKSDPVLNFIELMKDQKKAEKLDGNISSIGGEIHILVLREDEQTMWVSHRFDDYDSMYLKMLNKLNQ